MAITFQKEKLADCFDESRELQQQHFQEIAQNKDVLGGVNPDREMYMKLDALGLIHVLTARDDGKLVGYFVAFVRKHMHYQHIMCGSDDLFYLAPSHRRGLTGAASRRSKLFTPPVFLRRPMGAADGDHDRLNLRIDRRRPPRSWGGRPNRPLAPRPRPPAPQPRP